MTQTIFELALPLIKKWEGFIPHPYYCSAIKLTIGYGERIDLKPNKRFGGLLGRQIFNECEKVRKTNSSISSVNLKIQNLYPKLITEQEAAQDLLFNIEKEYWLPYTSELPSELNDNQRAAIISFVYNVGVTNFTRSTMFKLLQQNKLEAAGNEFEKWVFSNGVKLKGLENRRKEEKQLYFS